MTEFDYWCYEEHRGSRGRTSRTYHRFSCALTEIEAACPHLVIERESLLTRVADRLGFRDIEFESAEFNRAFQVTSRERKFANDLVDPRMMSWLLSAGDRWRFEVVGRWLLCSTRRLKPTELVPLLGTLRGFRDHVPGVVYSLYGAASAG